MWLFVAAWPIEKEHVNTPKVYHQRAHQLECWLMTQHEALFLSAFFDCSLARTLDDANSYVHVKQTIRNANHSIFNGVWQWTLCDNHEQTIHFFPSLASEKFDYNQKYFYRNVKNRARPCERQKKNSTSNLIIPQSSKGTLTIAFKQTPRYLLLNYHLHIIYTICRTKTTFREVDTHHLVNIFHSRCSLDGSAVSCLGLLQ